MILNPQPNTELWVWQLRKLLIQIILVSMACYIAYRLRYVAVIVALSVILALAVHPLVERCANLCGFWLKNRYWRRVISALFIFICLIALFVIANIVLFQPFQTELSNVAKQIPSYMATLDRYANAANQWYSNLPKDLQDTIRKQDLSNFAKAIGAMVGRVIQSTIRWLSLGWELILIPVLAFYFVVDYRTLKRELAFLVPRRRIREALCLLHEAGEITQSYVVGQLILCTIAGLFVWLLLVILGVKYPLTLAILAGITRAIPIVGPIIGGIPIVLLASLQSWELGAWVLGAFTLLHLAESKFIMPKLIGYRMHLHAAVVIIVLLIGGEFFGILGMFLAAPVAAIIKVLINYYVIHPGAIKEQNTRRPLPDGKSSEFAEAGKEKNA